MLRITKPPHSHAPSSPGEMRLSWRVQGSIWSLHELHGGLGWRVAESRSPGEEKLRGVIRRLGVSLPLCSRRPLPLSGASDLEVSPRPARGFFIGVERGRRMLPCSPYRRKCSAFAVRLSWAQIHSCRAPATSQHLACLACCLFT